MLFSLASWATASAARHPTDEKYGLKSFGLEIFGIDIFFVFFFEILMEQHFAHGPLVTLNLLICAFSFTSIRARLTLLR